MALATVAYHTSVCRFVFGSPLRNEPLYCIGAVLVRHPWPAGIPLYRVFSSLWMSSGGWSPPCPARFAASCEQVSSSRLHLLSSCVFSSSSLLQLLICVIFTSMSSSSVSSSGVDRTNDQCLCHVGQKNSHILGHVRCRFQRIAKSMEENKTLTKGEKNPTETKFIDAEIVWVSSSLNPGLMNLRSHYYSNLSLTS